MHIIRKFFLICFVFILASCAHNVPINQLQFKQNSEKLPYTVGVFIPKEVEEFVYIPEGELARVELGKGIKLNAHRAFADYFNKVIDLDNTNKKEHVNYNVNFILGTIKYLSEWKFDAGALGGVRRLFSVELIGIVYDITGKELFRQNGNGKVDCVRWECKTADDTFEKSTVLKIAEVLFLPNPIFVVSYSNDIDEMISFGFGASLKFALEECRNKLIKAMRNAHPT